MIRSCLFIPANNPGMLQTADLFMADSVIFDLEDAVSIEEKDAARTLLAGFLQNFTVNAKIIVRINNNPLWFLQDLETVVTERLDAVLIPKADHDSLEKTKLILTRLEKERCLAKKISVIPLIETAAAVMQVEDILARPRIIGVMLGAEDLTADMEIDRSKSGEEILYPRMKIALVARAYRLVAIDTPFVDVNDEEGLIKDATVARKLGMTAKAAIHPRQVTTINRVFSPTAAQIIWAQRVLAKSATSQGAFSLDGKMIDQPIVERAKKTIEKAKRYNLI